MKCKRTIKQRILLALALLASSIAFAQQQIWPQVYEKYDKLCHWEYVSERYLLLELNGNHQFRLSETTYFSRLGSPLLYQSYTGKWERYGNMLSFFYFRKYTKTIHFGNVVEADSTWLTDFGMTAFRFPQKLLMKDNDVYTFNNQYLFARSLMPRSCYSFPAY
jgi:hypothetical protein